MEETINKLNARIKELQKQEETYAKFSSYQFEENKLRYNKLNKELTEQIQELQEKVHILNEQSQNNYYRERYTEALKENQQLQQTIQTMHQNIRNSSLTDVKYIEELKEEIEYLREENQQLKQQLYDLPKKIVTDFYDEIRHRAMLEDDYCPDHNLERKYGVRKCLLENIKDTILKKYGGENDL